MRIRVPRDFFRETEDETERRTGGVAARVAGNIKSLAEIEVRVGSNPVGRLAGICAGLSWRGFCLQTLGFEFNYPA